MNYNGETIIMGIRDLVLCLDTYKIGTFNISKIYRRENYFGV